MSEHSDAGTTSSRGFCRLCLATCGTVVTTRGQEVLSIRGDPQHPVSAGYICGKGRSLATDHTGPDRLNVSSIRIDGQLRESTWAAAADDFAVRAHRIVEEHGPDAVGVFTGGGGFFDAAAVYCLRRFATRLGTSQRYSTISLDSAAKAYVHPLMAGASLTPYPSNSAPLLLLIGTNLVVSHGQTIGYSDPINRLAAARRAGEVWLLDPCRTETARRCDYHLQPRAGTDYALLAHLVRDVLDRSDRAKLATRAIGVDILTAAVAPYDAQHAASITGLNVRDVNALATAVHKAGRLAIVTGTGPGMAAAGNVVEWMTMALLVLTGSVDHPNGMWFNPGFQARLDLGGPLPNPVAPRPGCPSRPDIMSLAGEWPSALLPSEIEAGRLRLLLVLGANLAAALPNTRKAVAALRSLDALAVFDVRQNTTTNLATHLFACAGQLERNDVRNFDFNAAAVYGQYAPAAVAPREGRVSGWRPIARIAQAMNIDIFDRVVDPITADDDEVLTDLAPRVSLDELRSAEGGPVVSASAVHGWAEQRLPNGRWDLAPAPLVEQLKGLAGPAEMVLIPRRQVGRINSHTYRGNQTPTAILQADDAKRLGLSAGDVVQIQNHVGLTEVAVDIRSDVARGVVSIPHAWTEANTNLLTNDLEIDDLTGMPRLSGIPVTIKGPVH